MRRGFDIAAYEPFSGAYKRPSEPLNEAHLNVRDALEVYGALYDRDVETRLSVELDNDTIQIQQMDVESELLEGSVATRASRSTILDYQFTFNPPHDGDPNAHRAEYVGARTLIEPNGTDPSQLLAAADIVLDEDDLSTMLEDGTITAAELYDTAERHLPDAYTALDDLPGVDLDDTDPWFPPTIDAADSDGWTFRTVLHDRSRERDAVAYTVEIEAKHHSEPQDTATEDEPEPDEDRRKGGIWPFRSRSEPSDTEPEGSRVTLFSTFHPVGSVTFTIPHDSETLDTTATHYNMPAEDTP